MRETPKLLVDITILYKQPELDDDQTPKECEVVMKLIRLVLMGDVGVLVNVDDGMQLSVPTFSYHVMLRDKYPVSVVGKEGKLSE